LCAAWCSPCQMEQSDLVKLWTAYQGKNKPEVDFVTALTQDGARRDPTEKMLDAWRTRYGIPYPIVLDPQGANLMKYNDNPSYPFHLVVDTKRMVLAETIAGSDMVALKNAIDVVLGK